VTLEVERLGPGSERPFEDASLERMHGGRCDPIGNDSELGFSVDLRDSIDQLEVLRCVHDAPMTMMRDGTPARARSNRRAQAIDMPRRGTVRQSSREFISVQVGRHLRRV